MISHNGHNSEINKPVRSALLGQIRKPKCPRGLSKVVGIVSGRTAES